jgi:hypothetical protein
MDFRLIDGEFNQKDAKEIIIQLINDKINFHVRRNFSSKIRFGHADEVSENRIISLKSDLDTIVKLFDQKEASDTKFRLQANIEITPIQ